MALPSLAVLIGDTLDFRAFEFRPEFQKRHGPLLVVSDRRFERGGVLPIPGFDRPETVRPIGRERIPEAHPTTVRRAPLLGFGALRLLQILKPELGDGEHIGHETAANELACDSQTRKVPAGLLVPDQICERSGEPGTMLLGLGCGPPRRGVHATSIQSQ